MHTFRFISHKRTSFLLQKQSANVPPSFAFGLSLSHFPFSNTSKGESRDKSSPKLTTTEQHISETKQI